MKQAKAKAKEKAAPEVEEKEKFVPDLTKHEIENLVQITGRCMRSEKQLKHDLLRRLTACDKVTESDVKWAEKEVLRRSPNNDHREIVAQAIWP